MATQGEIIRGVVSYLHVAGSVAQNVFYWEMQDEDTADAAVLDGIETWLQDVWAFKWINIADSNALLYLLEVDVIGTDGLVDRNIGEEVQAQLGTEVGDVLPAAVSGFIQADTERAKSFGRKYVPFITENESDEGILSAGALGNLLLLLAAMTVDIDVGVIGVLKAGVLSRVVTAFLEFTGGGYATDIPAYQRRRKPGVGS